MLRLVPIAALLCATAAHAARGRPANFAVSPEQRDQVVKEVFEKLDQAYVFPEKLVAFAPQLRARWSSAEFRRIADAHALVDRMNADFAEVVHDPHLGLRLAAAFPAAIFADPDAPAPSADRAEEEAAERKKGYGVEKAEALPGNVGLLRIGGFVRLGEGQREAYAAAMSKLAGTRALIIDVRDNGGGDGDTVADLVGYLIDHKTLLQYDVTRAGKALEHFSVEKPEKVRYGEKKPVYVLTSKHTFSAAEECAYDLQTQKRATIVGEATGGGANHNRFFLVAGKFAFSVPYMTTKNAVTGKNWEGDGVQPDVKIAAADALAKAQELAASR